MLPCLAFGYGYWWIFPIIMLAMMVLCFFMMRGHRGSMMCGPGFGSSGGHGENASNRLDVLNSKNAHEKINKQEYQEKKDDIARRT